MACSPAYRHCHTATVPVTTPDVAKTIAQSVAQQCNAWSHKLYHAELNRYPAQGLLEEVIKELQERV